MLYSELEKIIEDQRNDFENQRLGTPRGVNFAEQLDLKAVTVVTGVRRCGKSTLIRQVAEHLIQNGTPYFYLNLDDPRLSPMTAKDFETVYEIWLGKLKSNIVKPVILLDEIQFIEGWEKWVNFFSQSKKHKVFITGSNSKLLSSELATFLTGRHLDIYLTPLSFNEIIHTDYRVEKNAKSTEKIGLLSQLYHQYYEYGGFPRVFLDKSLSYLPQYYDDIVQRDIIQRHKVRNKTALMTVAKILATETTRLVNHSKIARLLQLKDEATIRKYCQYFVETYLYYEIRCFSKSIRSQQRSLPKYYAVDHALAKSNGFWKTEDACRILELVVCSELVRRKQNIYYWKSKKNFEIDFILTKGTEAHTAIQVSYSIGDPLTEDRELRALDAAFDELDVKELIVVTQNESRIINRKKYQIKVIPIIQFLLEEN